MDISSYLVGASIAIMDLTLNYGDGDCALEANH